VAVPLIADKKVVGVIDSEHSKKNFFNEKHLNILSTIAVLCANQIQRAKAEEEKQKAKIEVLQNKQKVAESRLQSLRLQMNPHFLFNALNSIQQMILSNEELVATRFLSRFSKLLRAILIHSDKETVTLKEELEILNLYIELEARRFKDSFRYNIDCDSEIDEDEIKIPTLLIQPFVENAIWHGLMHKEGDRNLSVRFFEAGNFLRCVIEDNGVGRKKSEETKKANGQERSHISKGIKVSMERLKSIRNKEGNEGSLTITDLYDENEEARGTRVEINFPIQN
jgi:LytS/YehU family sensor histidine kinase